MQTLRPLIFVAALLLSACAAVSTQIVPLNPALQYAPTQSVEILLQNPTRPHVEIALLESRGFSEAELLNDAREKAKSLGADAIVRTNVERVDYPPVVVYDPWFDPFYFGYYRYRPYPMFHHPWAAQRVIGGMSEYVLKARAIKYTDAPG